MATIKTECSCGEQHQFDSESLKKMKLNDAPEYVECSECPICSPELFDLPEDHEDEAYKEEVNIEELEKALQDDNLGDLEEIDEEFDEEEY